MDRLKSVLLVDDDVATNFINELLIHKFDITEELVTVQNGKEALDFLQKRSPEALAGSNNLPDLILLDINMPVMDGFGFLQAFQELDLPGKQQIVIVVLTTSLNPKDLDKVREFGIADFMNKPLTKSSFLDLLEKHYA